MSFYDYTFGLCIPPQRIFAVIITGFFNSPGNFNLPLLKVGFPSEVGGSHKAHFGENL